VNANWHRRHVMRKRPSLEQRVRWHLAHAKACGYRDIPRTIAEELVTRRQPTSHKTSLTQ
jgi:hypothetical protein